MVSSFKIDEITVATYSIHSFCRLRYGNIKHQMVMIKAHVFSCKRRKMRNNAAFFVRVFSAYVLLISYIDFSNPLFTFCSHKYGSLITIHILNNYICFRFRTNMIRSIEPKRKWSLAQYTLTCERSRI